MTGVKPFKVTLNNEVVDVMDMSKQNWEKSNMFTLTGRNDTNDETI